MARVPGRPQGGLTLGKLYDIVASLMILIPCVLLLAWESSIPYARTLWGVLAFCTGLYIMALAYNRVRAEAFSLRQFLFKNGGFLLMFGIILYKAAAG